MRLDTDEPLELAAADDKRTGRKRKLSDSELQEFQEAAQKPPDKTSIDAPARTSSLVQKHLKNCGVEYSIPSCRRLLKVPC